MGMLFQSIPIIVDKYLNSIINMNRNIRILVENFYIDDTEQQNATMKTMQKNSKKYEKCYGERRQFIESILGKATVKKFDNNGTFAPTPLSGCNLVKSDFTKMLGTEDDKVFDKFVKKLTSEYPNKQFRFQDTGVNEKLQTDIVFVTMDGIIDFFYNLQNAARTATRTEISMWKPIISKFRNYLK